MIPLKVRIFSYIKYWKVELIKNENEVFIYDFYKNHGTMTIMVNKLTALWITMGFKDLYRKFMHNDDNESII